MGDLQVGDYVRWEVDIDKVYSAYTKTFVGKVGVILPPQEYYNRQGKKHLTPEGYYDVRFPNDTQDGFKVGNIPEGELVKVDVL